MDISFTKTRPILIRLNQLLKTKCYKKLELELNTFEKIIKRDNVSFYENNVDLPVLLLCLNIKKNGSKHCISSISCKINDLDNSIEISSKTHTDYEGKKYNLLLRSAIILLAQKIENRGQQITHIVSRAINPISAFSMVKYFNARNDELDTYMEENEIEPHKIKLEDIQNFFDEKSELDIDEDLTEEEESALMKENTKYGNIITLVVELNDMATIEKTNQTYSETIERIICPSFGGTKKRNKPTKRTTRKYLYK